jgi:hypothetical protein
MSSISSTEICPNCDFTGATRVRFYKTGEDCLACQRCGYTYKFMQCNERDIEESEEKWIPEYEETEIIPLCVVSYKLKSGCSSCFGTVESEEELGEFIKEVQIRRDDIGFAWHSFKDKGKWYQHNILTGNSVEFPAGEPVAGSASGLVEDGAKPERTEAYPAVELGLFFVDGDPDEK